jgi:hypothetical protein
MILSPCSREKELIELLARGAWPDACPPELRTHVAGCRACGDLVLVTRTLRRARAEAAGAANPGSPGALWWRAQLRRRNAAVERVGRPILGALIFAFSVNLLLAGGFLVFQARHGLNWFSWLKQIPQALTLPLGALWPAGVFDSGWSLMALIPALAALALLSGVVVYVASDKQ